MKLLQELICKTFPDTNCTSVSLGQSPRAIEIKTNKWDLIKHTSLCSAKETIHKTIRKPTEWEKIGADDGPTMGVISNICKQHMQLDKEKETTRSNKWEEDLSRHFSREDMQTASGHTKTRPKSLTIQFSPVQSLRHVRLCDPMKRSTPGLPVHHQLPEFTQTRFHRVSDAIQPSHPPSSPSPPAPNPSQHQSLFQLVK